MENERINVTNQYLTFKLGEEVFALDIGKVREVLEFSEVTQVPNMPGFMRGVINLRGGVVPVVDLRLKFGMDRTEKTVNTCIIIVDIIVDGEKTIIGALSDSVQEVMEMEPGQIEPPPKIGSRLRTEFITGMGKTNEQLVIILDIDRVFKTDELILVKEAQNEEVIE